MYGVTNALATEAVACALGRMEPSDSGRRAASLELVRSLAHGDHQKPRKVTRYPSDFALHPRDKTTKNKAPSLPSQTETLSMFY